MGCDIHSVVQVFDGEQWNTVQDRLFEMQQMWMGQTHTSEPFYVRHYGLFGFLADVRNYSHVPCIAQPRGLPVDWPKDKYGDPLDFGDGNHSFSWLSLSELLAYDYDQKFEADSGPGNGEIVVLRDFLGTIFFRDIEIMRTLSPDPANVRVVFGFDN